MNIEHLLSFGNRDLNIINLEIKNIWSGIKTLNLGI